MYILALYLAIKETMRNKLKQWKSTATIEAVRSNSIILNESIMSI